TEAQKANNIVGENTFGWQAYEKVEQRLVVLRGQIKLQRQLEKEVAEQNLQVSRLVERHAAETKVIKQTERDLLTEEQRLVEKRSSLAVDEPLKTRADRLPEIGKAVTALQNQIGRLDGRRGGLEEGQEKLAEGICPFFQEPCMNISERPPGDVFTAKFTDLRQERDLLRVEFTRREQEEALARNASEQLKAIEIQIKGVAELSAALVTKRQKNNARADGLDGLQNQRALAQQQLDEKQEALKAYCQLQGDIALAESEQKKHQQARDLYLANLGSAAKLEGLQAESKKFARLLACLQDELADKEKQQVAASKDYSADQHQTLRQQKDSLRQEVGALGQKVEWLKVEVERLTCEIDKLRKIEQEIAVKQQQIKAYGKREELVKFLRNRVFRNVSASLSERFREEISQRADRIYRIIAETDEELCWGDDYRILLRDMVDGELRERADDQLSGGQIMSAVVALRLAMLQTIGARIAFFDEPTSNLDATRRENLAHAFRAIDVGKEDLTEHWYDQLFLISHDVAFTEVTDQIVHLDPGS
ncbi:MAG: SMC family ATPase, partial [Geopsychrobacter sp.]|nr:SMC family ATPase [Geopsychrobacter sp.]